MNNREASTWNVCLFIPYHPPPSSQSFILSAVLLCNVLFISLLIVNKFVETIFDSLSCISRNWSENLSPILVSLDCVPSHFHLYNIPPFSYLRWRRFLVVDGQIRNTDKYGVNFFDSFHQKEQQRCFTAASTIVFFSLPLSRMTQKFPTVESDLITVVDSRFYQQINSV